MVDGASKHLASAVYFLLQLSLNVYVYYFGGTASKSSPFIGELNNIPWKIADKGCYSKDKGNKWMLSQKG